MGHLGHLKTEYQSLLHRLDAGLAGMPEPTEEAAKLGWQRILEILFTPEEAAWYLTRVMALDLPGEAISALERRTEGWIVGLQMAALSMQGREQDGGLAAFVEAFGGSHRYVLDYLMEEVLSHQPPEMARLMTATAILDHFCVPLCDALCELDAAPCTGEVNGDEFIARLQKDNLFLIAMDAENRWFRYHQLFRALLPDQVISDRAGTGNSLRTRHFRPAYTIISLKFSQLFGLLIYGGIVFHLFFQDMLLLPECKMYSMPPVHLQVELAVPRIARQPGLLWRH